MSAVAEIKARMQAMGIAPKKEFGQNFLVSSHVIEQIVDQVFRWRHLDLVEIGPGLGALTELILERGGKPRLIELDRDIVAYWRGRDLEVIDQDAIQINWESLNLRHPSLLVSNLPYQISTHLVVDRCFGPKNLHYMVLMFQKEVAERLLAVPSTKDYGTLSVMAQLHFKMGKVVDASPRDFYPAPKIASRVLRFERLSRSAVEPRFLAFVKAAFAFRRKFLLKNLKGVMDKEGQARLPGIFEELGLSAKARAEELTPPQFETLYAKCRPGK